MSQRVEEILQHAESMDRYREICRLSPLNAIARQSLSYTAWPDQTGALEAQRILREDFKETACAVVIMHPTADGGMPHTRAGDVICIPAFYPETKLKSTLAHELLHIDQRRRPDEWQRALGEIGWEPVRESELPRDLVIRCRLNPDTIARPFWCYRSRWIPLPLFERTDRPALREVQIRWWDRKRQVLLAHLPDGIHFGDTNTPDVALEHPYELLAYLNEE
jgi:hypothetical protein